MSACSDAEASVLIGHAQELFHFSTLNEIQVRRSFESHSDHLQGQAA
jgi:hypothetical protein